MGKRTYESDVIAMALLYRKEYIGTDMLSYNKALEFDSVINENLDTMDSKCGIKLRYEQSSELYRLLQDENDNVYAVINTNADLEKAWQLHVYSLPIDIIIASRKENALKTIGLKLTDGKIVEQGKQKVKCLNLSSK